MVVEVPDILIRKMFTCMDEDNSNTIELDEFLSVLKKSVRTEGADDFKTIFRATMTRLVAVKKIFIHMFCFSFHNNFISCAKFFTSHTPKIKRAWTKLSSGK